MPGIYDMEPAVEVVTNYFEDPKVSSGLMNMAVRKALWPMVSAISSLVHTREV